MPIRRDLMQLYPGGSIRSPEWQALRSAVRARSGDRCEGSPAFPRCRAANGEPHPVTQSVVVLTVAHLDGDPAHNGIEEERAREVAASRRKRSARLDREWDAACPEARP